jgi:N-acetylmuramic acid 6-phosphate etherase
MTITASEPEEFGALSTESVDPRYAAIDEMPIAELVVLMNEADSAVPAAVRAELPRIIPAIEAAAERMKAGGRLVYIGAGTAGRIGVLDASEAPPTFNTPPELVFGILAGGAKAFATPEEGAEDSPDGGIAAIEAADIGPLDTVIGIASSGRTPYVIAAIRRARELGALTVGLSCNSDTPLSAVAEHPIEVVVGPEVISGSTRLKAGTAQKLVLNMFSTVVMVQLGKTYGNLMVDVRPTNEKLRDRAARIVRTVSGADQARAIATLQDADYRVKVAILSLRLGIDIEEAAARLEATHGRLKDALGETS